MRILIVDDERMALEETADVVAGAIPAADIITADNYIDALGQMKKISPEVVLLDIEMPGMNGLELARKMMELKPTVNIIFVTAYTEYALEAFQVYASGYLTKPIWENDVKKAFANLRYPIETEEKLLRIQCFGNFEVFHNELPVHFGRSKAKELLAYLVELRGASANSGELCAVLWEDDGYEPAAKHYLRNLVADLKKTLKNCDAEEVFIHTRNQFSIDARKVDCDYYRLMEGDPAAGIMYKGEFMKQYSWAENMIGEIEKKL